MCPAGEKNRDKGQCPSRQKAWLGPQQQVEVGAGVGLGVGVESGNRQAASSPTTASWPWLALGRWHCPTEYQTSLGAVCAEGAPYSSSTLGGPKQPHTSLPSEP